MLYCLFCGEDLKICVWKYREDCSMYKSKGLWLERKGCGCFYFIGFGCFSEGGGSRRLVVKV